MAMYGGGMPAVDFSWLGNLPRTMEEAQLRRNRRATLAELQAGAPVDQVATKLFQIGDIEGGLSLAKLADARALREHSIKSSDRDYDLRLRDFQRRAAQDEDDRNKPQIYGDDTTGRFVTTRKQLEEMATRGGQPGAQQTGPAQLTPPKPKALPDATVKRFGEAGEGYTNFERLNNTFKDEYGGKGLNVVGDVQNVLGRNTQLGGFGDQAQWWQDYQDRKNIVRNQLFGSALTVTERTEFDKSQINPGMTPKQIRENLQRQTDAATRAARKMVDYYVKAGYDPKLIEAATGVPIQNLLGQQQPQTAPQPGRRQQLEREAQEAIKKGADPAAVQKRLNEMLAQ